MKALVLITLLATTGGSAIAQVRVAPGSRNTPALQARCEQALRAVETRPARDVPESALQNLAYCGDTVRAAATARAVHRMRAVSDTAILARFWNRTARLDDRNLFEAATQIALDRAAATPARVYALLHLVRTTRRSLTPQYRNLVGGWIDKDGLRDVRGRCQTAIVSHDFREVGTPLPPGWERSAAQVQTRLLADMSEPLDVRTAAWCIRAQPRQTK